MSRRIYDNWQRLVEAAVKKEQLWKLFHEQSRSPSICSESSDSSSSFDLSSSVHDVAFDFSSPGSSSRWPDAFAKSQRLVLVSDFNAVFDVEDMMMASSKFLGRGTFGSVYKAVMENGVTIVMKALGAEGVSELEFKQNMEIVGSIKHENVVALRAYYTSKDERLMLYDHYGKGSVYSLLHGQLSKNHAHVDWETRVRIVIGAARGLAEIHTQNDGNLVHGNIKASNIFVNSQQYGCISDLGHTNMIATTFKPLAWCHAPEVKNTQDVSQASDVYSFGVLILELLTRKSPVHISGGPRAVDLVKLVTSVKSKKWAAKVFDTDLLKHPEIKEQMVNMLQIGISCVAKSPNKRPKISEIVNILENCSVPSTGTSFSLPKKLIFVRDDDNSEFDLEDMLTSSAEVLGKGTFGTSYKIMLGNGIDIVVKRLKDVNVTLKEFEQHMEVIGRIRHANVAGLRAYYFSNDEKLLVYDYFNQDSVSFLLHGERDDLIPLEWEARLKIAVGAARGIAYIHKQDGEPLVHGNIKSSNIFTNRRRYGLVSEAGQPKVADSFRKSALRTLGYLAPEVTNTRKVSQASDVYSFGVVLLELVSGKQSQHTTEDGKSIPLTKWIQTVVREEWTPEVFDVELLKNETCEEEMVQLLEVALICVNRAPERRPKMPEVVKMLEDIMGIFTTDEPSIESRLEDLLVDLLPKLIS